VNRPRSRFLALVAVSALLTGACSDGGGDGGGDGESEVAANARAAAVNIGLTDLPEGYGAVPPQQDPGDQPSPLQGCVEDLGGTVTSASSPTFRLQTNESLRFVASQTAILADPGTAEELLDIVPEAPTLTCLSERLGAGFAQLLPRTTTEAPLTLAADGDFPGVGETSLRLAGDAVLAREGAEAPISVSSSLVLVRTGDTFTVLVFGGVLEPFPIELQRSLATTVADRQADRQG